ncbi:MAG: tRNA pseudouridine(38-40) synthase TruA [Thermodesulfobacteriota bacterium]|nr:tRNA pseudouridine(38-40) synthase TruA [Thermodesulfobacteriota bacterium]
MEKSAASEPERNLKLTLEYDGTGLAGWQRQPDRPTVQGFLETALARLTNQRVSVIGAGRTDAGVHARGQAANFKTISCLTAAEILRGGNALLPKQIVILSVEEAADDFHARYNALSKVYDYYLFLSPVRSALRRGAAWHIAPKLDLSALTQALDILAGKHDFAGFQSTGSPVRDTTRQVIEAVLTQVPAGVVRITFEADGFLRHMVRAMVGTLVEIGRGRFSPSRIEEILETGDRSLAGPTAPAHGLFLREVKYKRPIRPVPRPGQTPAPSG